MIELVERLIAQARRHPYFILTADEYLTVLETLTDSPHAALHIGEGRVITLAAYPVFVLPDLTVTT